MNRESIHYHGGLWPSEAGDLVKKYQHGYFQVSVDGENFAIMGRDIGPMIKNRGWKGQKGTITGPFKLDDLEETDIVVIQLNKILEGRSK